MELNVSLLRSSFELLVARDPEIAVRFCDVLRSGYPRTEALFGCHSADPETLRKALGAVVDHLDDASWLERTLGAMGRRHFESGFTHEMYAGVGASLIVTLAETAGSDWTPELEEAWVRAYGVIATLMKKGATAASTPAPAT